MGIFTVGFAGGGWLARMPGSPEADAPTPAARRRSPTDSGQAIFLIPTVAVDLGLWKSGLVTAPVEVVEVYPDRGRTPFPVGVFDVVGEPDARDADVNAVPARLDE